MIGFLSATTLGYLSGLLGLVIAVALVVSLTVVNVLVARVGGSSSGHVPSIKASLSAVAVSTEPVPTTLTAINTDLTELAQVLGKVEGHLSVARRAFDAVAESR